VVVEGYYRPLGAWDRIWVWHAICVTVFGSVPLVAAYCLRSFVPLVTWFCFLFGLEDTVFYGLQGYLPSQYLGIQVLDVCESSLVLVLQSNFVGLAVMFIFTLINWKAYMHMYKRN